MSDVIGTLGDLPGAEIYFNGDDTLTDFKIRCYEKWGRIWKLLGYYYPDFIILKRNPDKSINKVVIAETKGEGFAAKFVPKRSFMEDMFIRLNNDYYGREKFAFLYIEYTELREEQLRKTRKIIQEFLLK